MRISIMNDAADKIIAIFRLYIAQRKWNQLRSGLRDSKASLTGLRFLPNSGGMSSYRTYGSNDTYSSNTSKSTTSGTAGGRKRSEGSLSGANSLGDKKPQGSATRSSKYFTAKHLKGLASKLLYGKPKSPVELRNLLTKEASKLQTRISMELNASDFNDREYVNNMKSGPGPGQGPGRSRKNSIAVLRNSGGSAGPVRNSLKSEKPLRPQSPQLTPHEGETSGEVRQRGSMDLGSDSASTAKPLIKEAGRQSRNTERSVSTSSIHSEAERNRIKSVESSMQYGTSISSSSFFSVHENKQKINEELKDRQKRDYRDIKMLLRDRALKSKEKSYVLVTQKAYCLICSEEKHSALFQVRAAFLFSSLVGQSLICVC